MEVMYVNESEENKQVFKTGQPGTIPVYNVRMMRDVEVSDNEKAEYMRVNNESDPKKAVIAVAKIKWKKMIEEIVPPDSDVSEISDKAFKFAI